MKWNIDTKAKDRKTAIYVGVTGLVLMLLAFLTFDLDIKIGDIGIWLILGVPGLALVVSAKAIAENTNPELRVQNGSLLTGTIKILLLIVLLFVVFWMLASCVPLLAVIGAMG